VWVVVEDRGQVSSAYGRSSEAELDKESWQSKGKQSGSVIVRKSQLIIAA